MVKSRCMNYKLIEDYITGNLQHEPNAPTLDAVISANMAMLIFSALILVALIVGKYAIATKILGKKDALKSLIPFYGLMLLFRGVDLNPWLAITCFIPFIGIIPYAIFCFYVPKAFGLPMAYQVSTVFVPFVMFNIFGFNPKYEYQYVKGKNVAFKNEFRTVMPEDLTTPASAVNGAAVGSIAAKESMISRAASAAAEQTRIIREEQERQAEEEAKRKAEEEAKKKAEETKKKTEEFNYDIFSNKPVGPESASLNISFNVVNGRFQSAPVAPKPAAPAPQPQPAPAPAPQPQPASQPAPAPQNPNE